MFAFSKRPPMVNFPYVGFAFPNSVRVLNPDRVSAIGIPLGKLWQGNLPNVSISAFSEI